MLAQDKYFSLLKEFMDTTWKAWEAEIDDMETYIEKCKLEDKPTLFLVTKKNKRIKGMYAVKELIEAATEAVNQVPKFNNSKEYYTESKPPEKRCIADMPAYSHERYFEKILEILENKL
jgi:hypothetical protein